MSTASMSGEKTFVCTESGCNKSFLRSEHLARHKLNHRPAKIYSCPSCPKEFVRPDLYRRHKARHEKGMWYRQVGGVIDKTAQRKSTEDCTQPNRPHTSEINCPSQIEELSSRGLVDQRLQQDPDSILATSYPKGSDISQNNVNFDQEQQTSMLPHEVSEALFFDDTTNIPDLPDDLDWFFEPTQPDPLTAMGLQSTPIFPERVSILPQVPFNQSTPSPSVYTYDIEWTVARTNILASLSNLPPDLLDSIFFLPDNLATLFGLYFNNYHHQFPIIHPPTLKISEISPLLLTAIITLGATLVTDPAIYYLGQRIHDGLRWIILATGKFEPLSPLWCLQALLLVQAQGKMASTAKHHEMAHIFHGAILTMMKRGRAYSTVSNYAMGQPACLETRWRQWADDESSRRTAFFAFIMDAQHASVFGHTPVISVSDLRLPLPCADALWECTTAEKWQNMVLQSPKPVHFLPTLKALIGKTLVPPTCSDFSRFILLHGLLSLTTHLQARDNTTLGIGIRKFGQRESPINAAAQVDDWKDTMSTAIETWSFCLLSLEPSLCLEAAQPLHRMAFITLHTNITDFHTLAKDTSNREDSLLRNGHSKAEARILKWSRSDEAKQAVHHSLLLVKETVFTGKRYLERDDNIALRPWCLYHAVLVLWAFGLMTEGPLADPAVWAGAEEYVVRMLSALQRGKREISGANNTQGLIAAIADALQGCRWELLEEAHETLRRLK